jgi:uncharacterized protein
MKKLSLILLLFLCGTAFSQEKTLLYSVKRKGMPVSYLFGTVHLIPDTAFYFPPKLEKTIEKTEQLVLEINNLHDRAAAQQLMLLDSGTVFDIFTPAQADSVVQWGSAALKMQPEMFRQAFKQMKPFVLMQIATQSMMVGNSKSYEFELMSRANTLKIPILGLETLEYHIRLFDSIPREDIANMILEGIRKPEAGKAEQREMTRLYMEQDIEGLAKLIVDSEEIGTNTELLVFQRNRNWIPRMEAMMQTKSCFFAVGAGHLGGDKGVIQLLQDAGYTVTPIPY